MEISVVIALSSFIIICLLIVGVTIVTIAQRKKNVALVKAQESELNIQRRIARNTLTTQESERQQLGLELHDDLGPSFTAVKLTLSQIERQLKAGNQEKATEHLIFAKESLQESIQKFSDVSRILYPASLHRNGLRKAVEDVVVQCNNALGEELIMLNYTLDNIPNQLKEVTIFRICQELLNNAVKHSGAKDIKLDLSNHGGMIYIDYMDNGGGFDLKKKKNGLGLGSLKGRCEALGGALHFRSEVGKGTGATILIPHLKDNLS